MIVLRKALFTIAFLLVSTQIISAQSPLTVSKNHRYLVQSNGTPFFWLGDTGWALFHKLNRKDVDLYFKTRAKQGFSIVHAAVHHVNPFVLPPKSNMYDDLAFLDDDILKPNITPGNNPDNPKEYDYWDHVEYTIDTAAKYGMYINLLPVFNMADGDGYNCMTPDNAYGYGLFLGKRFKDKKNIVWCMGGDVLANNDHRKSVWNLLAKGVTIGVAGKEDYSKTLMTFHTRGGHSSSDYYPKAPWIDFDMLQTWDSYTRIYPVVNNDYNRKPIRPILHGEGAYEDGPEYPTKPINAYVIRKQVYWATFAGGLHTYGNSNVWSFGTNPKYVTQNWKKALNSPGANNLTISRQFFESVKWWRFVPDQSIITKGVGSDNTLNTAMRSTSGNAIIVYLSTNTSVTLDLTKITQSDKSTVTWFDPQTGNKQNSGQTKNSDAIIFKTPKDWQDALLIIESIKE